MNVGQMFAMFALSDQLSVPLRTMANNAQAAFNSFTDSSAQVGRAISDTNRVIQQFSGLDIAKKAQEYAVAIENVGGVANLTAQEQAQVNQVMTDFIAKAEAMGQQVPPQFRAIAAATESIKDPVAAVTEGAASSAGAFAGLTDKVVESAKGFALGTIGVQSIEQALETVTEQIASTIEAFEKEENAQHAVDGALKNLGADLPGVAAGYDELAQRVTESTSFSRSEVLNTIAVLTSLGQVAPGSMQKVLTATLDLAEGMAPLNGGVANLSEATRLMAIAMDGNAAALGRFIPELKGTKAAGADLDTVLQAIEKHFGGDAVATIDTLSGKIKQNANAWEDLKAKVGAFFAEPLEQHLFPDLAKLATETLPSVTSASTTTGVALSQIGSHLNTASLTSADQIFVDIGQSVTATANSFTSTFNPAIAASTAGFKLMHDSAVALNPAVAQVVTGLLEAGKSANDVWAAMLQAHAVTEAQRGSFDALVESEKKAIDAARQHQQALDEIAASAQAVSVDVEAQIVQLHDQGNSEATIAAALRLHESQVRAVITANADYTKAEKEVQDALAKSQKLDQELADAMERMRGESQKANAAYWKAQVDEAEKSSKAMADHFIAGQKAIAKASDDLRVLIVQNTADSYDQSVAAIDRWADEQKLKFPGIDAQVAEFGHTIDQEVTQKVKALGPEWIAVGQEMIGALSPLFSLLGTLGAAIDSFAKNALGSFSAISKGISNIGNEGESLGSNLAGLATLAGGVVGLIGSAISFLGSLFGPSLSDEIGAFGAQLNSITEKNLKNYLVGNGEELKELQGQAPLTSTTVDSLFAGIAAGGDQASKATQTLTGFVTKFQDQASQTSGIWSAQMHTIIDEAQKTGQSIDAITAALKTQAGNATSGLNSAFGVYSSASSAYASDQSQLGSLLASGSADPAQVAKLNQDLAAQAAIIKGTAITTQQEASGLAAAAVQTVNANMRAGMSFVEAAKAAMPAIEGLKKELADSGFQGSQAFTLLSNEADLLSDAVAGPLITNVEGMTQAMVSLANTGDLTSDSFAGLTASIGQTYDTLVAQGKDSKAVLAALQPDLQAAWQAEQQFGYKADDTTQQLIDQGVQAGLVGEKQKSSTDQMIDALNQMVTLMKQVVGVMIGPGGMTDAASQAARAMNGSFSTVQGPNLSSAVLPIDYPTSGGKPTSPVDLSGNPYATTTPADLTIADIPLSTVTKSGLIWVRAGYDYVGGSPKGASGEIGGASTTTAPLAGSSGGGQMASGVSVQFGDVYISGVATSDPKAFADAFISHVSGAGAAQTRLVTALSPVLRQRGVSLR